MIRFSAKVLANMQGVAGGKAGNLALYHFQEDWCTCGRPSATVI